MRRLLLLTACLWSLPSCDINVQLPAYIDASGVSEDDARTLLDAADEWYVATDGAADLTSPMPDVGGLIKADYEDEPGTLGLTRREFGRTAIMLGINGTNIDRVAADPAYYGGRFTAAQVKHAVYLHELGHAMGLSHEPQTIMDSDRATEFGICVDEKTLRQFCRLHTCDGNVHSTCPPPGHAPDAAGGPPVPPVQDGGGG